MTVTALPHRRRPRAVGADNAVRPSGAVLDPALDLAHDVAVVRTSTATRPTRTQRWRACRDLGVVATRKRRGATTPRVVCRACVDPHPEHPNAHVRVAGSRCNVLAARDVRPMERMTIAS